MSRKDLVKEIVATAAPIFIKKALKYLSSGETLSEDDIASEVIAECEEVHSTDHQCGGSSGDESDHVQYAGPYGNLVATLCMIIDDLANDIKSQVAQELMMKMHIELAQMRDRIDQAKLDVISASKIGTGTKDQPFGGIPEFDVTEDDVHLDTISTGYASIEKYAPSVTRLEDNPLFAMVSKSVDRSRAGLSTHTAEDLNAARRNRFTNEEERLAAEVAILNAEKCYYEGIDPSVDVDTISKFSATDTSIDSVDELTSSTAGTNQDFKDVQEDVSTNDSLWDKMFAERYGSVAKGSFPTK